MMTMNHAMKSAVLLLALTFGATSVALAGDRQERLVQRLGLSEQQAEAVIEITADAKDSLPDMQAQRAEVTALVDAGDVAAAAELAASYAKQRVYARAEIQQRLSQVLTDEQLQQFESMQKFKLCRGDGERAGRRHGVER